MTDEADTNDETADETTTTPDTPPDDRAPSRDERMFSESEVADIVKKRLDRERRKQRSKPPSNGKSNGADDEVSSRELRKFDRAMGKLDLNETQIDVLEGLFSKDRPDNVTDWVAKRAADLGWATTKPADKGDAPPSDTDTPKMPPASDKGPATAATGWERKDDPTSWTQDDIGRILREKGTAKGRNFIRQQLEGYLKSVRIVPPVRR